ncbi:UvrD/REP helicase [Oscillochloris trichoides DG-6]|uniref:DNA 3'-5' helicase n=1 Tax=Oscillochloris trichoides DG-6 TaxID=765420 RepID=E1ID06_9CHLR|nr:ATP-dependent helicase [Oscillochloris trichoides]EFO80915.1 UvrD/REP helicase [Oscillochloris trichoides DG-6]
MLHLTDQQHQIVAHSHGPALVFAVAGAGKTTAMVHRVERLVRERVFAPRRILLSSFNRAAVDTIGQALDQWPHCKTVTRQTLHALGFKIIRHAAQHGALPAIPADGLKTNGEERTLLWAARDLARQRGVVSNEDLDALDEQDFLSYVAACKSNLRYPDLEAARLPAAALALATQAEPPPGLPYYRDLYRFYEELRHERGWITFDDMLLLGWEVLVRHADLRQHWQQSYDAVLVDEFQDVSLAQAEMLDLLVAQHRNVMAIGDDDQTIYGFRGAQMAFFRGFAQRYNAKIYEMTDNFRCRVGHVILANRVIAQNRERHPKTLVAARGCGGQTQLHTAPTDVAMARRLVDTVAAAHAAGYSYAQIAVLVRLNAHTPLIEQALITAHIPYHMAADEPFFRRREIADLLAYADLAAYNQRLLLRQPLSSEQAERLTLGWRRLYNRPKRYLNRQLAQECLTAALHQQQPLSTTLPTLADRVSSRVAHAMHDLADLLLWLGEAQSTLPAADLLAELDARLGYQDFLATQSGFPETGAGYAANVEACITYAQGKGSLAQFRAHLAQLETERTQLDPQADAVDLRTIHRAKGLEWPVVLLPFCNAGHMPFRGAEDLEEERRIFYVALTRAREELHLYAVEDRQIELSPFLRDVGATVLLRQAEQFAALLERDPRTWSAAETLNVATFPREYGQERLLRHWWQVPPELRRQVAGRVVALLQQLADAQATQRLGLHPADQDLWAELAGSDAALPDAPFSGIEHLLKPPPAPKPSPEPSRPAPYRVGERVQHPHFGQGTVIAVEAGRTGRTLEWYLTVRFNGRAPVKLLAGIAPIRRVEA